MSETIHAFGENGELSRGAEMALRPLFDRLYALEQGDGVRIVDATNLLSDSTFNSWESNSWLYYGSSGASVNSPVLRVVGTGALVGVGIYTTAANRITGGEGRILYLRGTMRVTDPGATTIRMHIQAGGAQVSPPQISAPVENQWYTMSANLTSPAEFEGLQLQTYAQGRWPSGASADGKGVEMQHFMLLDLTRIFGVGNEPAKEDIDDALLAYGGHFEGTRSLRVVKPTPEPPAPVVVSSGTPRSGNRVLLRFDDGYESVRTLAAPIMAEYGYVGTLLTGTHPTEWLGTTQPGGDVMTQAQLLELADMGWEIGSHTRRHDDAIHNPSLFVTSIQESIQDIVAMGLPYPVSFAYPNGSRTPASDVEVYKRFSKALLTGGPENSPMPYADPMFFSTWAVIDGITDTQARLEVAKRYVEVSFEQGNIPVLGFHGFTEGTPSHNFNLDVAVFRQLIEWLAEKGYPTGLFRDTQPHNLIADPGFERYVMGYPWTPSGSGGWLRLTSAAMADTGMWFMRLNVPGGTTSKSVGQRINVEPGTEYEVRAYLNVPTRTAGQIFGRVSFLDYRRATVAPDVELFSITDTTSGYELFEGQFTAPPQATVAYIIIEAPASGFSGDARLDYVQVIPADLYNPLDPPAPVAGDRG